MEKVWVEMKALKTNKQGKKRLENVRREGKKKDSNSYKVWKKMKIQRKKTKRWDFAAQNTVH